MTGIAEFLIARLDEDEQTAWEAIEHGPDTFDSPHQARWWPPRVLREVKAKRRVLERHAECGTGYGYCDDAGHVEVGGRCPDLKDAVAPYADHPDYDPAWRAE